MYPHFADVKSFEEIFSTFSLQGVLGSEGISLEFRHIASYLLWYCSHWPCEDILHNIIPLVGFFAVNNKENQVCILTIGILIEKNCQVFCP